MAIIQQYYMILSHVAYVLPTIIALLRKMYFIALCVLIICVGSVFYHAVYLNHHTTLYIPNSIKNSTNSTISNLILRLDALNGTAKEGFLISDISLSFFGFLISYVYSIPKIDQSISPYIIIISWCFWIPCIVLFGGFDAPTYVNLLQNKWMFLSKYGAHILALVYLFAITILFLIMYKYHHRNKSIWYYYKKNFNPKTFMVFIFLLLVGGVLWGFIQNINAFYYFPTHSIWHVVSSLAISCFVLSIKSPETFFTSTLDNRVNKK